jgi:hypothetical protein
LCLACNTSIGILGDNLTGLMVAVRYLEAAASRSKGEPTSMWAS